ncbi:protein kinase, partial [Streptomyces sp. O3]
MDDYAGRVLADRYRLPLPPSDEYEFAETRAFDTYSGQEVLVRQVPLPEVVDAELLDGDQGEHGGHWDHRDHRDHRGVGRAPASRRASGRTTRRPTDPAVRRAIEAAQAAAQIPDHPRLDQVFDVFAEGGSLWIVSEMVAARPLAALLAEQPLSPYRAAEVASDVLTAVRALHAHGWVHRNITARTVLVCDDGRVMLTGLAAGAAEEALCGYDPVPVAEFDQFDQFDQADQVDETEHPAPGRQPGGPGSGTGVSPGTGGGPGTGAGPGASGAGGGGELAAEDVRAARAGAIAAYRAGARAAAAAARADEERGLPGAAPGSASGAAADPGRGGQPRQPGQDRQRPGRIADPYGVTAGTPPGGQPGALRDFRVGRPPGDGPNAREGQPPGSATPGGQTSGGPGRGSGAAAGWHGAV